MVIPTSTPATKAGRISAAVLGMLLCASAPTPAAGADSADTSPSASPLYGYFREARGGASVSMQQTGRVNEIRRRTDDPAHVSLDGEAAQPPGVIAGATTPVHGQLRALAAQYRPVAESAPGLGDEGEVLLRNSDAFLQAKVRLTLSKEWRGFVYADVGAVDSELRWQGLAGIHGWLGVDLLGGWRHVTYRFSPGRGFDSLEFNGPYLAATLAW